MPSSSTIKPQPVAQADRIQSLDILRGVALLGILMMNIPLFAMPERFADAFSQNTHSINFWTDAVVTVLFEGKMRALFSMLFGVGILLFTSRKQSKGQSIGFLFFKRMAWLVVFGLIHAHLLLWQGDILYFYGVIGMLAFLFRNMKPQYLALGVPIVAIVGFVTSTLFYQSFRQQRLDYNAAIAAQAHHQKLTPKQAQAIVAWKASEQEFIPNKPIIDAHTQSMKTNYSGVAKYIRPLVFKYQTKYLLFSVGDILALMLLGMALYKWKFFTGGWTTYQYRLTMLIGYGVGLPLVILSCYHHYQQTPGGAAFVSYLETHDIPWWQLIYPFQRMLLVMAHASVILLIARAGIWKALTNRLAAVGQMAFTNYVMHTVICTLYFFGYGFNQFAQLKYYQLYYVVAIVWTIQLMFSPLWLKCFLFGPLEWLWRSLTYWQLQPIRRHSKPFALALG